MNVIRGFCNAIIGIILFALIFMFSFIKSTKSFLEKDLILGVVKGQITETIKKQSGKLSDKSQELLDDILSDKDISDVIRIVLDNYEEYQIDKNNFKVNKEDIDKIINYANKYKSTIIEISGEKIDEISDEEFKKIFSEENINQLANEVFSSIDEDVGDGVDTIINVYSKVTSSKMMLILMGLIIFSIGLLLLINWSLYKWLLVTGIDLIISGLIITFIFLIGVFFTDMIGSTEAIGEINLNGYIIWGGIEVILGIAMIIVYSNINKKKDDEKFNLALNGNKPKEENVAETANADIKPNVEETNVIDAPTVNTEITKENVNTVSNEPVAKEASITSNETNVENVNIANDNNTNIDDNTKQIDDISQN